MSADVSAHRVADNGAHRDRMTMFRCMDEKTQQELRDLQALKSLAHGHHEMPDIARDADGTAAREYGHGPDVEIHGNQELFADLGMDIAMSRSEIERVARCAHWVEMNGASPNARCGGPSPSPRSSKEDDCPSGLSDLPTAKCFSFFSCFPTRQISMTKPTSLAHEPASQRADRTPILKKRPERGTFLSRKRSYTRRNSTVSIFSARSKQQDQDENDLLLVLEACMFNIWRDNQLCSVPAYVSLTRRDYVCPKQVETFPCADDDRVT